jgi:rubrerythrin
MSEIKLYDERDYDFYNPKPYLQHLVNICILSKENQNRIAYDIDDDKYNYLFAYQSKEDAERSNKKTRVFCIDFVNLIKFEHIGRVKQALERSVNSYASNIYDSLRKEKDRIKELEKTIANAQTSIEERKKELRGIEDVIAKYASPSGTSEVPF